MAAKRFPHELLLALLRILIGWHFLYEGLTKLMSPGWSAAGYLAYSTGPFASLFHWLGANQSAVRVIDQLNMWGLTLVGLGLMLGVLIRPAATGGIALLALYYLTYPPLFKPTANAAAEGQYLLVNMNLVELFALLVVVAYPAAFYGLGSLLERRRQKSPAAEAAPQAPPTEPVPANGFLQRRQILASLAGLPFMGGLLLAVLKKHGLQSFEEIHLRAHKNPGDVAVASATTRRFEVSTIRDLKGQLPYGTIGNVKLSRMILGGNLIGGWAHSRDLIYVSKLVQAYHTRSKIFQTLDLAESCGVNTIITNPALCGFINDYWKSGGKIQFISDCNKGTVADIQKSIDNGACACYVQGGAADKLVAEGKFDDIAAALDLIRKNRLPAGIGGHKLATIKACVEKGLRPDFWMKTLHPVNYWSAKVQPEMDNIFCDNPEETAAFMHNLPEPWIAFKVLAAGAIEPAAGFKYAFEQGADVICVGMYDFQIVDDVNIAFDVFKTKLARTREWRA